MQLYTPFAQENSIAPGTGLGLSLVKSMVTMLNGEINIQSTLGVGTEVTVQFPMTLSSSTSGSTVTSGSTPTSAGSIERVKDNSLALVQQKVRGRKAFVFPEESPAALSSSAKMIRDTISRYLKGWYGLDVVRSWPEASLPNVIITDEADLAELVKRLPNGLDSPDGPIIVILCSAASRHAGRNTPKSPNVEALSYPFGPYKLAKCIRLCLEKIERNSVVETDAEVRDSGAAADLEQKNSNVEEVISNVEQMTITNPDPNIPDVSVIRSGKVMAHEDSVHAGLLVESSELTASSGSSQEKTEYPFPLDHLEDGTISPSNLNLGESERPNLAMRRTISAVSSAVPSDQQPIMNAAPTSSKGAITISPGNIQEPERKASPRLLLVDDNRVNLRLLQTFMKKRLYTDIFSAEDGHQAVSVFQDLLNESPPHPPDIIFMDIVCLKFPKLFN
jgi:CheY-like chemotaxis protein